MPPFTIPTTSAADELEHLTNLRAQRALASLAGDADLVGDLDYDIEASADALRRPRRHRDRHPARRDRRPRPGLTSARVPRAH